VAVEVRAAALGWPKSREELESFLDTHSGVWPNPAEIDEFVT